MKRKSQYYEAKVEIRRCRIVRTDDRNRGKWPLAIVQQLYPGPDGLTRAVLLKTKNGEIERPVQHLYPLELHCDAEGEKIQENVQLDPNARLFRSRRTAAVEAIKTMTGETDE